MLKSITAVFDCDRCGVCFNAEIDPAMYIVPGWSPYEMAEDGPAVGDTQHLCKSCTEKEDKT